MERLNEAKAAAVDHEAGSMKTSALEAAARAARQIESAGPGAVLAAWRRAWRDDPQQAAADEVAGRAHEHLGELLVRALAGLPIHGSTAA